MNLAESQSEHILDRLFVLISSRRDEGSDHESWTAELLASAPDLPVKKLLEEAGEVAIEAMKGDAEALTHEAADLFYHLLVVLAASGVSLVEVWDALERRQSQSGRAEKAARKS